MLIALVHRDLHAVARGGVCTLYLDLADALVRAGHRVVLITQDTPHPVRPAPGVDVYTLPRTDDLTAHRQAVAHRLAELRPDVAECSTWEAELLDYLRAPGRAPVLVRGDLSAATMRATSLVNDERALCGAADAVVAVSEFAAADLATAYGIPRPTVVANGVDRARFTPAGHRRPASGWQVDLDPAGRVTRRRPLTDPLDTDPCWAGYLAPTDDLPRLVWVGKFTQMKGFDRLQRIAARLAGRARLLIVLGHGQVHYPVALSPEVLICQDLNRDDMPAVYRGADFLLSTSRWEGYGLAIAEALACGTPALLPADLAVATELITDRVTGARWADEQHLLDLLADRPALTGALADRYTWAANAAATVAVYERLVHGRGR
ncbi:MAG: glycosyltransferase family 4 protein [Dactylosporangium sp.]|nr:glycosyltransferase family 4 protein [Dactylosporangium sp.]NNJ63441.1 glycosyltransferase family 4 protein [Dactylosporangium sp.]